VLAVGLASIVPATYVAEVEIEIVAPESSTRPSVAYPTLALDAQPSVVYTTLAFQVARRSQVIDEAAAALDSSTSRGDVRRSTSIGLNLARNAIVVDAVDRTKEGAAGLASALTASFQEVGVPLLEERVEDRLDVLRLRIDRIGGFLAKSRNDVVAGRDVSADAIAEAENQMARYADSLLFFERVQAEGVSLRAATPSTSRSNPVFWQNAGAVWLYLSGGLLVLNRWKAGRLGE
jgi:hypothetical protein